MPVTLNSIIATMSATLMDASNDLSTHEFQALVRHLSTFSAEYIEQLPPADLHAVTVLLTALTARRANALYRKLHHAAKS